MAVLIAHPGQAPRLELRLGGRRSQPVGVLLERPQSLGVRLQVLEIAGHAWLGEEVAHYRDVAVPSDRVAIQVERRRFGDPLDRFHEFLL